jgi:hypothetical protein
MTTIVQKECYLRQAARCYEIAASVTGERAASMVRLGDTYSALAEDPDAIEPPAIYVERQCEKMRNEGHIRSRTLKSCRRCTRSGATRVTRR